MKMSVAKDETTNALQQPQGTLLGFALQRASRTF